MATETVNQTASSFSDPRVILVRSESDHLASFWDETQAGFEQDHDGPTHLIIGRRASDERLHRLATRFGRSFDELRAFRDGEQEIAPDQSNPETCLGLSDFCDPRVFAVPASYSDRNAALVYDADSFDVHKPNDGPAYIVVGSNVDDARLLRHVAMLGERFGAKLGHLQDARAGKVVQVR